ncbi:MAG TPA: hypothetical protein VK874_05760 [Gaiellaceae bacterium]|nr:hypothetical protein [Gaiellaceae bacterium]
MAADAVRSGSARGGPFARLTTETKQAFKTTEFWMTLAIMGGILIASAFIGDDDSGGGGSGGGDVFNAWRAWLLVTGIGAAYVISRGLAKAGSRDPYWSDLSTDLPGSDRDADQDRDLTRATERDRDRV